MITPLLKDIATIKCAVFPPLPLWLPFAVQSGSKPSLRCPKVMLLTDLALYPFFFNKFLTVSSQTLLPSPKTNRRLLIPDDPRSSFNLRISRKRILSSLRDTFFCLPLLNLRLSKTCVESIDLTACRYRLILEYSG